MDKNSEATVQEAADFLGVSQRSVINYIKSKEVDAVKVGKVWYIKRPSLDAFSLRYGLNKNILKDKKEEVSRELVRKKDKRYSVKSLRLFQLAQKILYVDKWKLLKDEGMDAYLSERLLSLRNQCIELLGSGYYSFAPKQKSTLYSASREKIGGILSLLYFYSEEGFNSWDKEMELIETELLPAYSSLIRRVEKNFGSEKTK